MGINIGAFISPLLCGYLAQGEAFRQWLAAAGFDPRHSWHWGFGAAGVGMLAGLFAFGRLWRRLDNAPAQRQRVMTPVDSQLQASYARRFAAIGFFCVCAVLFFAMSKQAGSSLNLFADQHTRTEIFGWAFPSSWFQSVSALWVIVLAPIFSTLWLRLGTRQPSSPAKVVMGLAAASTSFVIMTFAAQAAGQGPVSPVWLLAVYLVQTIGEMCVSPVGLSNVTRLAPPKLVGFVLGLWFVAIAFGAKLAGLAAAWMGSTAQEAVAQIFAQQAVLVALFCALLALTIPRVRRLIQTLEASR
jgi:POT family proton-dependent oligopeptide transporter